MSGAMRAATAGGGVHRGLGALDRRPRPPGQDVVEGPGHLLAGRVDELGPGVGQPCHDRLEQLRAAVGQGKHLARPRCRSGRGGAHWGWASVTGSRVLVVAPSRRSDLVTQRRRRGDSPRRPTTTSTVSWAILRYVVSLPPVTVTTPWRDVLTVWRRERSAVRSETCPPLAGGARSGRRPAQTPVTSARVRCEVVTALAASSR